MTLRLILIGLLLFFVASMCALSYQLGKSNARVQIITKQVEVIKYVQKKRAVIQSRPNAGRDELLRLMRASQL